MTQPSAALLASWATDLFGVTASATLLPGELDWNARLDVEGAPAYVLKVHHPATDPSVLALQDAVLEHVALTAPRVAVPRLLATAGVSFGGHARRARLLEWLPGTVWADAGPPDEARLRALGATVARLDAALAGFDHPALDRPYRWNMRQAAALLGDAPFVDEALRPFVHTTLSRLDELLPALSALPQQAIHNDANEHNVLVGSDSGIAGLLDVGDVVRAPRVCGLAVALAYAQFGQDDPMAAALPVLAGYHAESPVTPQELALLPDLVDVRLAMSVVNAAVQRRSDPGNSYLAISQTAVRGAIESITREPRELREARFRDACGYRPIPRERRIVAWLQSAACDPAPVIDRNLAADPPLVLDWTHTDAATIAAVESKVSASGHTFGLGRYREDRDVYRSDAFAPSQAGGQARTVHLGVDLFVPAGEPVFSPLDGTVRGVAYRSDPYDYGGVVLLEHATDDGEPFWLLIGHLGREIVSSLTPGQRVRRGDRIAWVGVPAENGNWPPHVHVQLFVTLLGHSTDLPGVIERENIDVWESICPDPNVLLRLPVSHVPARDRSKSELARRRRANLAPVLSLSYADPLHIVAGEGAYLIDADGRRYLDLVNNVAHVGHGHPRVVSALAAQAELVNTNTRYLHGTIIEYARRLAATFPDPLSVVILTNSGSEANDLALRMARTVTGREHVLVLDSAYHGNLSSLVELSPYKFNRAGGNGPGPRVRVCELPDAYRGRYGADGPLYATDVAAHCAGAPPAAFLHESILGCAGQIEPAPGYLVAAYAGAREAGALCIADEVQCGFGRVGSHMWAFEAHNVVPDIVTLGKPIGNGHPLGAVVTTPAIARAFQTGMEYFNTYGGNPVSCAAGLAVLDVLRDERLMAHAAEIGAYLTAGMTELATRHSIIGDVRGRGLFLGVDLVEDRNTKRPAAADAAARVVESAREDGVLLSLDGPHGNVLKIKPPLVLTRADAEIALATLDRALAMAGEVTA
ncbi:aminotransferase class III-fold pyridoxal phosphate-dependent enzyme [Nonomuraea sp. NPDC049269]|uniref:aminotransferase class III-fold pyridoxal phosphate-dependent enzyme n=1 Tax=Nonomuraea sp. NPDC049269 TaxID=3364349 RepID=UPI003713B29E